MIWDDTIWSDKKGCSQIGYMIRAIIIWSDWMWFDCIIGWYNLIRYDWSDWIVFGQTFYMLRLPTIWSDDVAYVDGKVSDQLRHDLIISDLIWSYQIECDPVRPLIISNLMIWSVIWYNMIRMNMLRSDEIWCDTISYMIKLGMIWSN